MALAASDTDWRAERKAAQFNSSQAKMLASARRAMDRWGLSGMEENAAQERIAALTELSGEASTELFFMEPDEAREAAIKAVVRAHLREQKVIYLEGKQYEPDERQCKLSGCEIWFKVTSKTLNKMYCCPAHERRGEGRG